MMRYLISLISFSLLFILETSFLTALPGWLSITPLVLAMSVYLIQHQGQQDGLIWLIVYGWLVQSLGLSQTPFPVIGYAVAGGVCMLAARHVFSNRSLYGVLGCGLVGELSRVSLSLTFALFTGVETLGFQDWQEILVFHGQAFLMLLLTLILLFSLLKPLNKWIRFTPFFS